MIRIKSSCDAVIAMGVQINPTGRNDFAFSGINLESPALRYIPGHFENLAIFHRDIHRNVQLLRWIYDCASLYEQVAYLICALRLR
jgi:hypothetical protein